MSHTKTAVLFITVFSALLAFDYLEMKIVGSILAALAVLVAVAPEAPKRM